MYCNIVFMIDIFVISKITQYRYYVIAITDVRSLGLSTKWRTLMIKKTMKVRENTFRKLEDPFENGAAKKYVFYVKVDDVAEGIPMATNPRDQKLTSGVATAIKESLQNSIRKHSLILLRRNRINRLKSVKKAWNLLNSLAWIALRTVVSGILIVKSRLIKMAMLS